MCGIVGCLGGFERLGKSGAEALLQRMADTVVLRGPDDAGYWCDVDQGVGLGHQRLAIVDLTAAGHQPMHSASGRYVIVLNGEIYSHADFRQELEREIHPQEGLTLDQIRVAAKLCVSSRMLQK